MDPSDTSEPPITQSTSNDAGLLDSEMRKAKLEKLAELKEKLRRKMQQNEPQLDTSVPPPKLGYGYANCNTEGDDTYNYFEDEYYVEDDVESEAEEAFLCDAEVEVTHHHLNSVDVHRFLGANDAVCVKVETNCNANRSEVGDFELLRLAKMGDWQSFHEYACLDSINAIIFNDNRSRNALHYAADSGNVALLRELTRIGVPFITDEKGMTPLDIAVLNNHDEEVRSCLLEAARGANHIAATTPVRSFADALATFAPAPPKFVMGKAAPRATLGGAKRVFWGHPAAGVSVTTPPESVEVKQLFSEAADFQVIEEALQRLRGVDCNADRGSDHWLKPLEKDSVAPLWPAVRVVGAVDRESHKIAALVLSLSLGGVLKGFSGKNISVHVNTVAAASHLIVEESCRGKGIGAAIMGALATVLKTEGVEVAVFFTPSPLPSPPVALCLIKWFCRVLTPGAVFQHDCARDLFPDYYSYEEVLRADCIAKGALSNALWTKHEGTFGGWTQISGADDPQTKALLIFLETHTNASAGLELAYVPKTVDDLRGGLLSPGMRAYARVMADNSTVDFVVFRVRETLHDAGSPLKVAQVVYALFTGLEGVEKTEHLLLISERLINASALLVPTLYGLTDSDLAKANMDELVTHRKFLYAVSTTDGLSVGTAVTASKVSVPTIMM